MKHEEPALGRVVIAEDFYEAWWKVTIPGAGSVTLRSTAMRSQQAFARRCWRDLRYVWPMQTEERWRAILRDAATRAEVREIAPTGGEQP